MDLKLDTTTHDLIIENYDLALVDGIDLVRQAIKQRLLLVLEEWFLDDTVGVPWYQYIFQKGADINRVKSILINTISGTEGVIKITSFELDYNNVNRSLSINFTAETNEGIINVRFNSWNKWRNN